MCICHFNALVRESQDLCLGQVYAAHLTPALEACLAVLTANTAALEAAEWNFLFEKLATNQSNAKDETYRMLLHHRIGPDNTSLNLAS